ELIRRRAAQTPPGDWIRTSNAWHESNLAEGRLPTAPELDQATRDHPVWVKRGGHVGVANSRALALARISAATPDPPGGAMKGSPDGPPTGKLLQAAAWTMVERLIPPPPLAQRADDLRRCCQQYNALGLGTIRDPIVTPDQVLVYQALRDQGGLSLRCRPMFLIDRGTAADQMAAIARLGVRSGFGDDWLAIWGLKALMDGGVQGAALDQPYIDPPGYAGELFWETPA